MDIALFDFDGTITYKDTFSGFIYYAVDAARIRRGKVQLAPLVLGYKLGLVSGSTLRARIAAVGFSRESAAAVRELGAKYAANVLPGLIRRDALERISWHQARGDRVVVVSASLDVYLSDWCREWGVDLISTELEAIDGVLTGRYLLGDCSGKEKPRRVRQRYRLSDYGSVFAYGDTKEDRELLALADKKFYRWREL